MAAPSRHDSALLRDAAEAAIAHVVGLAERSATPTAEAVAALAAFDEALPDGPESHGVADTLRLLADLGGPAAMGSAGPHYYGFVNGATLPAALGASFLADAWDQNAALPVMSPIAARLHDVSARWLLELFDLDRSTDVAFVTGATVANATCLAAARDTLLAEAGWDVQRDGLFGAPEIDVVIGERAHSTLSKSLGLVGLGRDRVTIVPADDQGRLIAAQLPDVPAGRPLLVCAQAGEVNTGAFDPFADIVEWAAERSGWVHVDGAFGMWALADPGRASLVNGLRDVDSLATDGHKWLNVTYDCGIAFVRRPGALRRTFAAVAGYLPPEEGFEAMHHTPQSSQRARQIEVWAVLRSLGRDGVAELVRRACDCAALIAERIAGVSGIEVLNDVVLNQVLVRCIDGPTTERLVAELQRDGRIWCGPTQWDGATAMRISVSSWQTTLDDAAHAADVIADCAAKV
ncbi:MAG: pyridoxal-dependent decarboxylase [Actinomycetota bacterium]